MNVAEIGLKNQTCKFCINTGCKLNIPTEVGCPISCISYEPNNKTKVKNGFINWKYSVGWITAALILASFFEVIKL